MSLRTGNQIDN